MQLGKVFDYVGVTTLVSAFSLEKLMHIQTPISNSIANVCFL